MRARRGNYSLLFVLLSGVLFAMLAFSIDIGRLRVAQVGAENAAEAAAEAALMRLRAGYNRNLAEAAANNAANLVSSHGLGGGTPAVPLSVNLQYGEWQWARPYTGPNSRWTQTPNGRQAVKASVQTSSDIGLLFGGAFQLMGQDAARGVTVRNQATAAIRSRDIVLLVDVSQMSGLDGLDYADVLTSFIDELHDLRIQYDRIAVVGYAGETWRFDLVDPDGLKSEYGTMAGPTGIGSNVDTSLTAVEPSLVDAFYDISANYTAIRSTLSHVMPCFVGSAEFVQAYRFTNPAIEDLELDYFALPSSLNYRLIHSAANGIDAVPDPNIPFDDPVVQTIIAFYSGFTGYTYVSEATWNSAVLSPEDQGYLWTAAEGTFLLSDPRVMRGLDAAGYRSPLHCYEGNDRFVPVNLGHNPGVLERIPEVITDTLRPLETAGGLWEPNPLYRYGDDDGVPEWPDLRYYWAGSDPAIALQEALDILRARPLGVAQGEPTVILLASKKSDCGPNISEMLVDCFGVNIEEQAGLLSQQLAELDANVYVIGNDVTDPGQRFFYNTLWQNRGYFTPVSGVPAMQDALRRIASDAMIQVVE